MINYKTTTAAIVKLNQKGIDMKQHSFNQTEVLMLEKRVGREYKIDMWDKFKKICEDLDLKVRVTGGNFLTHDINTDEDDFNTILQLTAEL